MKRLTAAGLKTGESSHVQACNLFWYLSFRHAKFMKIDAHTAVCSVTGELSLMQRMSQREEVTQVIHVIVDSLWVHKDRIKQEDCEELRKEIKQAIKFKLTIEGIYKWIVFLPSKVDPKTKSRPDTSTALKRTMRLDSRDRIQET